MAFELLGGFYNSWWQVIDFFIYLIIFGTIAKFTFSKQWEKGSASNAMAIGIGIALSIAMVALEIRNGFNISTMGCLVAAFVILGFVGFITHYLVSTYAEKNDWRWLWYVVGFIVAIILIDIFFSLGFCASPFGFGLFNWFGFGGTGGTGSGMPHSWSSAPGSSAGNWLDWIMLLLALFAIYWMLQVLEGSTEWMRGHGHRNHNDHNHRHRDRDHDRRRDRDRERNYRREPPRLAPVDRGELERAGRFQARTFQPGRITLDGQGAYTGRHQVTGRGFVPGMQIEFTFAGEHNIGKLRRIFSSSIRRARGLEARVGNVTDTNIDLELRVVPHQDVNPGDVFDAFVRQPNGAYRIIRNAVHVVRDERFMVREMRPGIINMPPDGATRNRFQIIGRGFEPGAQVHFAFAGFAKVPVLGKWRRITPSNLRRPRGMVANVVGVNDTEIVVDIETIPHSDVTYVQVFDAYVFNPDGTHKRLINALRINGPHGESDPHNMHVNVVPIRARVGDGRITLRVRGKDIERLNDVHFGVYFPLMTTVEEGNQWDRVQATGGNVFPEPFEQIPHPNETLMPLHLVSGPRPIANGFEIDIDTNNDHDGNPPHPGWYGICINLPDGREIDNKGLRFIFRRDIPFFFWRNGTRVPLPYLVAERRVFQLLPPRDAEEPAHPDHDAQGDDEEGDDQHQVVPERDIQSHIEAIQMYNGRFIDALQQFCRLINQELDAESGFARDPSPQAWNALEARSNAVNEFYNNNLQELISAGIGNIGIVQNIREHETLNPIQMIAYDSLVEQFIRLMARMRDIENERTDRMLDIANDPAQPYQHIEYGQFTVENPDDAPEGGRA